MAAVPARKLGEESVSWPMLDATNAGRVSQRLEFDTNHRTAKGQPTRQCVGIQATIVLICWFRRFRGPINDFSESRPCRVTRVQSLRNADSETDEHPTNQNSLSQPAARDLGKVVPDRPECIGSIFRRGGLQINAGFKPTSRRGYSDPTAFSDMLSSPFIRNFSVLLKPKLYEAYTQAPRRQSK